MFPARLKINLGAESFDYLADRSDSIFIVRRSYRNAQSRGAFRNRWTTNCWNEESFTLERRRQIERCLLVTDDPSKNRASGSAALCVHGIRRHQSVQQLNFFPKQKSARFAFRRRKKIYRRRCSRRDCGRRCGGINEGASGVNQPFDEIVRTADVTSACAERCAQSSHLNIDLVTQGFCRRQAEAVCSDNADSMRVRDHQEVIGEVCQLV